MRSTQSSRSVETFALESGFITGARGAHVRVREYEAALINTGPTAPQKRACYVVLGYLLVLLRPTFWEHREDFLEVAERPVHRTPRLVVDAADLR